LKVVLTCLLVGVIASVAVSQQDSGRQGKGGGPRGPDPEESFKQFSGGKDVIVVSEMTVPERMARWVSTEQLRERMNAYLQKKGITGGRMTLDQYKDYAEESRREMMEKMQKGDFSMFKRPDSSSQSPSPGGSSGDKGGDDVEAKARESFKEKDTNKDGFITVEELQALGRRGEWLYRELANVDTNKDGKIDVNEYVAYYKSRFSRDRQGDGKGGPSRGPTFNRELDDDKPKTIPEEKRVVYRIGSLPKELPSWYTELDKDKDGQIGLYEWKAAGKDVKEFLDMDANKDGFVTVEEILRSQRAEAAKKESQGKLTSLLPMQSIIMPGAGSASTAPPAKGNYKGKGGDFRGKGGDFRGKGGDFRGKGGDFRGKGKGSP